MASHGQQGVIWVKKESVPCIAPCLHGICERGLAFVNSARKPTPQTSKLILMTVSV